MRRSLTLSLSAALLAASALSSPSEAAFRFGGFSPAYRPAPVFRPPVSPPVFRALPAYRPAPAVYRPPINMQAPRPSAPPQRLPQAQWRPSVPAMPTNTVNPISPQALN